MSRPRVLGGHRRRAAMNDAPRAEGLAGRFCLRRDEPARAGSCARCAAYCAVGLRKNQRKPAPRT
ncbi:hypothetical protein WT08_26685 [Burkholderia sp. MSMB1552]|nr:hypothetical protein WT08_26685 [Burkholderia sp. MSMB1552]KWZ55302.1 hypothetical protein WS92_04790 [Burkholderia sp. MSMB1588]